MELRVPELNQPDTHQQGNQAMAQSGSGGVATDRVGDQRVTVFFDGGCPMCRREIAHYRRLQGAERLDWRDIHADPDALFAAGISWQQAMERLHVQDGAGALRTGAHAFVTLWRELPGYRWLARMVSAIPGVVWAMDHIYTVFARWRWRRRCRDGACGAP
jgi:predicted DCC family thiol-disulfide oxidoreductase YuxK